jgi:heme/copper-type cytochrome/quinol oxidase subunit 1
VSQRLNVRQRVVLVVGLAAVLAVLGAWGINELVPTRTFPIGWTGYAPLQSVPVGADHALLRVLLWVALIAVWVIASTLVLRTRRADPPAPRAGDPEAAPGASS